MSQDYELIQEVFSDGDILIKHYVNKVTGLNVYCAYTECPIVKGDLLFATEAHDDDGLPHTLEHLVFMGSEDYPFKGILDRLANQCFANGTNAYTDTDYTNYTVSTAGQEGFLTLLPIYLDHLLFANLKDSAFTTEVHHVDGKGEDAGIVYCEMQACENTGDTRCHMELLSALYPDSGYKSNTGGLMWNLRNSVTNEKCRNYHKKFYHTKNLGVIVVGPVEPEEIFKAIKPIEDKAVAKQMHKLEFVRPWSTPVAPLKESYQRKIQYPSDTDDDGLVYIGFRGPNVDTDYVNLVAVNLALEYLNSTAISPIQQEFVECEEPYCSSVSTSVIEFSTSCFYLSFESVGKQYLDRVADKLHAILRKIIEDKDRFDITRMRTILSRRIVRILSSAENSPHSVVASPVIGHFLYGSDNLKQRCQEIPILKGFMERDAQFWLDMIEKFMVGPESRHAVIVGEPSPKLMESMLETEQNRLKKQKEDLQDDLPKLAENLKLAIEANEVPIPDEVLRSVEVPSPEKIKFHQIERVVLDKNITPFRLQYDSIKTNFVSIYLMMNTSTDLAKNDRLYLPLIAELLFECPIMRDGRQVPYETVVAELYSDTIAYSAGIGLASGAVYSIGALSMLFGMTMQVEVEKYEKAVEWCKEVLYNLVFSQERIKTVVTRMISDISQYKRSGGKVMSATMNALLYQSNSNRWASNFMRQQKFLKNLLNNIDSASQELTRIRKLITQPSNILIHLSLQKEKIDVSKVHIPWLKVHETYLSQAGTKVSDGHISLESIIPCCDLVEFAKAPKAAIIGVGSVESNYLQQSVKSLDSPTHADLPALYVLINYLTQLEGPLWRSLRGQGLSYSYNLDISPSEGLLRLTLSKSTQVLGAHKKFVEVVSDHISGKEEFDDYLLTSAKSTLIFELIRREKSPAGRSMQSLIAYIRGLDMEYNRDLMRKVAQVNKEDMRRVGPLYLKPLFEDEERRIVVCCNPAKVSDLIEGFAPTGCQFQKINLEEEPLLNEFS